MDSSSSPLDGVQVYLNHIKNSHKKKFPNVEPSDETAAEAKQNVHELYKKKLPNFDTAVGELAPVFGLGEDLLAKQRAQGLFKHPAFVDAWVEFADRCLRGRWDLPVGDWAEVHKLFHRHRKDANWARPDWRPYDDDDKAVGDDDKAAWGVDHHYARFVIRTAEGILKSAESGGSAGHMAWWLKGATVCDACFILLFALTYLQLETMRDYRRHAPAKDRISHAVDTWKAKVTGSPKGRESR
ncbi:hypothetical protein Hte_009454 [Hypoxylon texense]